MLDFIYDFGYNISEAHRGENHENTDDHSGR